MGQIFGVLFAAVIGMMSIPTINGFVKNNQENISASAAAAQQSAFNAAVAAYVKQNATAIQAVADATTPATITVAMLQASGVDLLPQGFNPVNIYGQTLQAQVLEPTPGNLQVLSYSIGGDALPDARASKIASLVKPTGGFIPANDSGLYASGSNSAQGAFGAWSVSTANYGNISGGHLATLITFNSGQLGSNYLYRNAVPGQPQLNQMNTPLVLASVQTAGNSCSTTVALAQDGSGNVLSCSGGVWKKLGGAGTTGQIFDFGANGCPTGSMLLPWSQTNVSRQTYAALFAAIGTTWGAGDGVNTFGLPYFPQGYASVQVTSGVGAPTSGQVISHTHRQTNNAPDVDTGTLATGGQSSGSQYGGGTVASSAWTQATGGSANLAAGMGVQKCIWL